MPVGAAKRSEVHQAADLFGSSGQRRLVLGLLLVALTLAVYNLVAHNGFVNFDDDHYVTSNPEVRAGLRWRTIAWAFTSLEQANWHPLTWLSHALDYTIFRMNPAGHHYMSLLFHAVNALLLFLILDWFTGYTGRSLMVAAVFAVHPLNVESVAWVAERKNVLCMFFLLLAIAAYGWYVRRPGLGRYILVAILYALALMSKPMAITLPFVLLLLDYWPLQRWQVVPPVGFGTSGQRMARLSLEKVPLLAPSAASAVITLVAQRRGGAVLTSAANHPLLRIENVIVSYGLYLKKAFWPSHLAVLYPYPHAMPEWKVIASAMVLAAISLAVVRYRAHRYLVMGWLWYLITMVPMIGLVQVGNQAMADRYAYLPSIGAFIMAVWAVADWASQRQIAAKYLATVGIAVILCFSGITRGQIAFWHDDLRLWSHALAVTENNYVAENNFAHALIQQGRPDEAIVHFRAAAAIEPDDPVSELNLGIYAQEHGDLQQAASRYRLALQLATDSQLRANAYANLGTVYFTLRDYDWAQQCFDSAAKLKAIFPIALLDMGLMAQRAAEASAIKADGSAATPARIDKWNQAAGYFAQSVDAAPSDVGYLLLANALRQAGRGEEADAAVQKALHLSRNIAEAERRAVQLGKP